MTREWKVPSVRVVAAADLVKASDQRIAYSRPALADEDGRRRLNSSPVARSSFASRLNRCDVARVRRAQANNPGFHFGGFAGAWRRAIAARV